MCILEIAVFNIQSALDAANAGADRLELCENPLEGGTTPSIGTLQTVRRALTIPVFPIIRPRGGDFCYSPAEFQSMLVDVANCKRLGFEGIVTGILHKDGSVDVERMQVILDAAFPMDITFHRAFDRAANPFEALEDIIRCGCQRVLTSGQHPEVSEDLELVGACVKQADGRIVVMPGSGIRSNNIVRIATATGTTEFHSSARMLYESDAFVPTSMREVLAHTIVDNQEVAKMKKAIQEYFSISEKAG